MISVPFHAADAKSMAMRIGFIGLGVMGTPMAGHLAKASHSLTVLDVDRAKAERLAAAHSNVVVAPTPREVAQAADVVVTTLPSGEYVRDVALGKNGLIEGFEGGELLIDTSSCEPWITIDTARALATSDVWSIDSGSGAEMGRRPRRSCSRSAAARRPETARCARTLWRSVPSRTRGTGHAMSDHIVTATCGDGEGPLLNKVLGLDERDDRRAERLDRHVVDLQTHIASTSRTGRLTPRSAC
jgi:hypothetical protein